MIVEVRMGVVAAPRGRRPSRASRMESAQGVAGRGWRKFRIFADFRFIFSVTCGRILFFYYFYDKHKEESIPTHPES